MASFVDLTRHDRTSSHADRALSFWAFFVCRFCTCVCVCVCRGKEIRGPSPEGSPVALSSAMSVSSRESPSKPGGDDVASQVTTMHTAVRPSGFLLCAR